MKARAAWLLLAVLLLAPAWLLGTESGLQAAVAVAQRLAGPALVIGGAEGRLLGDVFLRDFCWCADGVEVSIDRAEVNLRLSRLLAGRVQAERLDLGELRVATLEPEDAGTPPADDAPLTVHMPLRLAVEEGRIGRFRLALAGSAGEWGVREVHFGARWRGPWIVVGVLRAVTEEAGPLEARGRLAIIEDRLRFVDFEVEGPGVLRAAGDLALAPGAQNELELSWENIVLPWAELSSARGTARLEGPWDGYRWTLQGQARASQLPAEVDAAGRGDLRALTVERARLDALAGVIQAHGTLDWSGALRTEGTLAWSDIDPARLWKDWPGRLNGDATLAATWQAAPDIAFDVTLRDSQLRGYPVEGRAVGRTDARKVSLETLALRSGASALAARGALWPAPALSGELRSTDLASLWRDLGGRAQLRLGVTGTWEAPRVAARGTVEDLSWRDYRAARGTIDADVSAQGRSRVELLFTDVDAGLRLRTLAANGDGTRRAHRLRVAVESEGGNAVLALEGALRDAGWTGRLVEARATPPAPAEGQAPGHWTLEEPAALSYQRGRFELEPACLGADTSRACLQVQASAEAQYVALRAHDFELRHLRPWLREDWTLTGAVTGTASLRLARGELAHFRADLASTAGALQAADVRLAFGPGALRVQPDGERLHAEFHLRPAGGDVEGDIWVAPGLALLDRPMLGDLRLHLPDLAWLPVLSPEIAAAQGSIDAELHVSGTPRSPSLDGHLRIADGRVQLTTPGIELADITASFERGRDAPLRLQARARSGDGVFTVDGEFRSLQPRLDGELAIRGEDVLGVNRSDVRAWLSPDLKLVLDGRRARLTGTLGVPRAEITPKQLDQGGVGPSADQVLVVEEGAAPPGGTFAIESEVKITLGDAVRIDGLGLKTRLTGALTAFDDPERPTRARGELRLDGGRYKAYGQDLQIETGRLIFSGGPITAPAIDLTAVRKPREDIKVGLRARGTLEAPEFSLFSEPAMSQEEQLSWLVLGRSLSATLDSGQRTELSSAALSLGLTGGEYLAQQLAPRLGLGIDEVTIGARPGETADLARFTVGKYLSPKLFVSYGIGLFQPGHFFRLQYDVTKRVKLVGESGVQQGGDLLYTIER